MFGISVIVPCFNCRDYILNCIKSLNIQSFKDFEVIFIDDYSNDGTYEYLEKVLKSGSLKYTLIKNNANMGPGATRNKGIYIAKGQYIAFLDSDDMYDEKFLETMYNKALNNNLDVVMCNYYRVYSNGKRKPMYPIRIFKEDMTKKEFLAYSFDSLCCMLIKKGLFTDIELPELFNAEDVAVIPVILSNATNIGFVKENLYNYFHRANSLSNKTSNSHKKVQSILDAYCYISKKIESDFKPEVEFLGIKIILYGATLNALYGSLGKDFVYSIIDNFNSRYPEWSDSTYINSLPKSKRFFLYFVANKNYGGLIILSKLHKIFFKLKIA